MQCTTWVCEIGGIWRWLWLSRVSHYCIINGLIAYSFAFDGNYWKHICTILGIQCTELPKWVLGFSSSDVKLTIFQQSSSCHFIVHVIKKYLALSSLCIWRFTFVNNIVCLRTRIYVGVMWLKMPSIYIIKTYLKNMQLCFHIPNACLTTLTGTCSIFYI